MARAVVEHSAHDAVRLHRHVGHVLVERIADLGVVAERVELEDAEAAAGAVERAGLVAEAEVPVLERALLHMSDAGAALVSAKPPVARSVIHCRQPSAVRCSMDSLTGAPDSVTRNAPAVSTCAPSSCVIETAAGSKPAMSSRPRPSQGTSPSGATIQLRSTEGPPAARRRRASGARPWSAGAGASRPPARRRGRGMGGDGGKALEYAHGWSRNCFGRPSRSHSEARRAAIRLVFSYDRRQRAAVSASNRRRIAGSARRRPTASPRATRVCPARRTERFSPDARVPWR